LPESPEPRKAEPFSKSFVQLASAKLPFCAQLAMLGPSIRGYWLLRCMLKSRQRRYLANTLTSSLVMKGQTEVNPLSGGVKVDPRASDPLQDSALISQKSSPSILAMRKKSQTVMRNGAMIFWGMLSL